jgi:arylsulfatase A-like enzyme
LPAQPLVRNGVHFADQPMDVLGPQARNILWNRYRNSMLYMDDLVGGFVESLDPHRTIAVITGDHGEAFGEGNHFGHVDMFGRTPTHTPLIIWGQGVPPGSSSQRPTCHTDVMPTVFALLGASRRQLRGLPGRDLLSTHPLDEVRHSQRFFYSISRGSFASNILLVSERRRLLMLVDRKEPRVVPLQFEGPEGEVLTEEPTDSDIDDFRELFRELH